METYIKERLRFKDAKLNIDDIDSYTLNLYISKYEFAFSVYNPQDSRCLRLESFTFPAPFEFGKNDDVLLKIFEDNHLLPAAFWKSIKLFVASPNYTFIPTDLYSPENKDNYLAFNCGISADSNTILQESFDEIELVYSLEKSALDFFSKIYPSREIEAKSFLTNILPKKKIQTPHKVFTFLDQGLITVYAYKNGKFSYCNTSHFKNIDDALYYIMMVYNELNLNPESVPLEISGNSDSLTLLKSRVFKFVKDVYFGSKPDGLKLCYEFDELEDGRFYGILNAT